MVSSFEEAANAAISRSRNFIRFTGSQALPIEAREALADVLAELARDSRAKAEQCWKTHKAPMAAYWKAVSVYAGKWAAIDEALIEEGRLQRVSSRDQIQSLHIEKKAGLNLRRAVNVKSEIAGLILE